MSRFVYLIDADPTLNQHLVGELARYGLRVEAAAEATDIMQRKDDFPSLVVLCIDPKRTGWAVCNRLRKSATLKSVPLIITSAEATEKDFEDHKKLKTRAEDYVHKPFGVEALVEKIAGLIGLPEQQSDSEALEIPIESEEINVEEDGVVVEEEVIEAPMGLFDQPPHTDSGFISEDSQDRTRIGVMNIDGQVDLETDAAFAAIGSETEQEENTSTMEVPQDPALLAGAPSGRHEMTATDPPAEEPVREAHQDDPFGLPSPFDGPQPLPEIEPEPMPIKSPSVDLDLGLDDVARQASREPVRHERARRPSSPGLLTSAPAPAHTPAASQGVHDTSSHDTSGAALAEVKSERDRLRREVEELRGKLQQKQDAPPASTGFSREREFLNLREIINKKEKEILDLRDSTDAKERLILDGKDRLRELDRRVRDLDEKALTLEKEHVAAKEKIEALQHDKDRVVEREKQVKGRLDDALKSLQRYEEEIEGWKKKHADDTAVLEKNYNDAVASHQQDLQELRNRNTAAHEALSEQHASQLREHIDSHEAEKHTIVESHEQERGRLEAEHAGGLERLRETKDNERESMRILHETTVADLQEQHQVEVQGLAQQHATQLGQVHAGHEAAMQEKEQLHVDELAGLRSRHTQDNKLSERKHADETTKLHEGYRGELQSADQRRQDELGTRQQEHQDSLEQLAREHLVEKGRLEREHEEALQSADERRHAELQQAAETHTGEMQKVIRELEQKLADEVKAQRESSLRKVQALEESHADLKTGMQQRHAQQVEDLQKNHGAVVADFEGALKERDGLITENHNRISELEGTLSEEQSSSKRQQLNVGDLEGKLAAAQGEVENRDRRIADKAKRIEELEQESAGYQEQILKAYGRIKSDESIVSRAKKALAIALTLLDESAADSSEEKSS